MATELGIRGRGVPCGEPSPIPELLAADVRAIPMALGLGVLNGEERWFEVLVVDMEDEEEGIRLEVGDGNEEGIELVAGDNE